MAKPKAPTGLKAAGKRLWQGVIEDYELRPDEVRLLEHAARTADLIEDMRAEIDRGDLMVKGSMGQSRPHPLLTEIRGHRTLLAALLKQLKLPDEQGEASGGERQERATKARQAARARWGHRGA